MYCCCCWSGPAICLRARRARASYGPTTFVDYEHGVNTAINRIREALGDVASNRRFVETLARRGYRFTAPVQRVGEDALTVRLSATSDSIKPMQAEEPERLQTEQMGTIESGQPSLFDGILASPHELPKSSHAVVQTLFVLMQLMYVGFYVGALANPAEIEELISVLPRASEIFIIMIVTAVILIPVRAFMLTAALMHPPRASGKLLKM